MNSIANQESSIERSSGTQSAALRMAAARAALGRGESVVLSDGGECALVVSATAATTASVAGMIRAGSGLVFAALPRERLAELGIGRMTADGETRTARFHVAVDAAAGIGTGISATDRGRTLRLLADPGAGAADFVRPGHVIPVAGDIGSKQTPGLPELALALVDHLDHPSPVAAYCALTSRVDPRLVAGPAEGADIARRAGMVCVERGDVLSAYYGSATGTGW